jgi:hypothetical protein
MHERVLPTVGGIRAIGIESSFPLEEEELSFFDVDYRFRLGNYRKSAPDSSIEKGQGSSLGPAIKKRFESELLLDYRLVYEIAFFGNRHFILFS